MEQGLLARRGDWDVPEETTDPSRQNPCHDQNQQRRPDVVHDDFEMASTLGALHHRGRLANERGLRRRLDDTISFATFAASGVEDVLAHMAINS